MVLPAAARLPMTRRTPAAWAVTLTPAGTGWLVWDIEPASAGNS